MLTTVPTIFTGLVLTGSGTRHSGPGAMFWTTEVYADDDAFAAHSASEVHAAASRVCTELIAASDFIVGETLMAKGSSL